MTGKSSTYKTIYNRTVPNRAISNRTISNRVMTEKNIADILKILLITLSLFLFSCNEQTQVDISHQAQAIEKRDECHLCGMLIMNFSGPKGEIFKRGLSEEEGDIAHKFCSTRDMFSFYLDPENTRNVSTILVHDMSKAPWNAPSDSHFIDARGAWYVVGSNRKGAMGKTLASFSLKSTAQVFAEEFNGQVIRFNDITYSTLR
ncbi:MAG: copper chaperone NosL [Flavobacteriales bacterium]|jgi:copper chaperone NosL